MNRTLFLVGSAYKMGWVARYNAMSKGYGIEVVTYASGWSCEYNHNPMFVADGPVYTLIGHIY